MGLFGNQTPEEQLVKDQAKWDKHFKRNVEAFWASPAGLARSAFERGDHVLQFSLDVLNQDAIIVAMVGSTTTKKQVDPSAVVNSVCHEGWEIVNGDFVFVMTGQQSRDKFLSSGQNVAVAGTVMGYYLFKRCPDNQDVEDEEDLLARLAPGPRPEGSQAQGDLTALVEPVESEKATETRYEG